MPRARKPTFIVAALLLIYAIVGCTSLAILGNDFIANYSLHPAALAAFLGIPSSIFAAVMVRQFKKSQQITSSPFSLMAFLFFTITISALLFGASSGWVAFVSELLPKQPAVLELTILSIGRSESRRSVCHRYLELQNGASTERLCADKLPVQGKLDAHAPIKLVGVASPLGLHIRQFKQP